MIYRKNKIASRGTLKGIKSIGITHMNLAILNPICASVNPHMVSLPITENFHRDARRDNNNKMNYYCCQSSHQTHFTAFGSKTMDR